MRVCARAFMQIQKYLRYLCHKCCDILVFNLHYLHKPLLCVCMYVCARTQYKHIAFKTKYILHPQLAISFQMARLVSLGNLI